MLRAFVDVARLRHELGILAVVLSLVDRQRIRKALAVHVGHSQCLWQPSKRDRQCEGGNLSDRISIRKFQQRPARHMPQLVKVSGPVPGRFG